MNVNVLVQELQNIKSLLATRKALQNEAEAIESEKQKRKANAEAKANSAKEAFEKKNLPTLPKLKVEGGLDKDISSLGYDAEYMYSHDKETKKYFEIYKSYKMHLLGLLVSIGAFILQIINVFAGISIEWGFDLFFYIGIAGIISAIVFGFLILKNHDEVDSAKRWLGHFLEIFEKSVSLKKKIESQSEKEVDELDPGLYGSKIDDLIVEMKQFQENFAIVKKEWSVESKRIGDEYVEVVRESKLIAQREDEVLQSKIRMNDFEIESITLLHPTMFGRIDAICKVLTLGRADSLKEAINTVLNDERLKAEADRRAEQEERSRRQSEEEARRAADAAEKAAKEAKQKADDDLKARQDAAFKRCLNCAYSSITADQRCSNSVREGFRKSGDVCPSYRPKSR